MMNKMCYFFVVSVNGEEFLKEAKDKIPTFRGIRYCSNNLENGIRLIATNEKHTIFWGTDTVSPFLRNIVNRLVSGND